MKEKKQICTLLIAMLILAMAMLSVGADPPPKLFVDPPTYTGLLGEVFTIDINIANIQDLWGFEFKLGYNTTLLDALDAVKGPLLPPSATCITKIYEPEGYVFAYGDCGAESVDGSGTLVTITFEATSTEPTSCTLHLYDTKLFDYWGDEIVHDVEDGNYKFVIKGINVATDKPNYGLGETVEIHGNVTLGSSPYQGLVALEVDDPANSRMVVRTLQTGPTPPPGNITIVEVYSSNAWGDPKESFHRGIEKAYFKVTVFNSGSVQKNVTITVNAYDSDTVPFGVGSAVIITLPGLSSWTTCEVLIPEWTSLGTATVYANAFTNYPRYGGTPYCPEKSATFQILNSTLGATALETQGSSNNPTAGNYSLAFKLSTAATTGIYRVYATAFYKRSIISSTVFGVNAISVPDDYPTIQEAVDAVTPTNNSIMVLPRTYNEHVTINKTATLVGADPSNTIINGSGTGTVVTVTANDVEISRFIIQNSGGSFPDSGIVLNNSSNSIISENKILDNYNGIYVNSLSQGNTIRGNTITSNNGYGVILDSSDNNDILDNTLSNNNYGIYLSHSTSTTLRDNNMIGNNYNFGVFGDFNQNIDTSNTVDGKPIIYWINQENRQVPPNAGFVAIVGSKEIVVKDLNLTKNGQGVLFASTRDSLIERVNTINNEYGIYLHNSYNNTIIGSSVSNNTVGIYQRYSSENIICHNNFINNTNQVDLQSSNTWDDGGLYPCPICGNPQPIGNYWSDYEGLDDGTQTQAHNCPGDGVGDTLLPHLGVDYYPLIDPWILVHDIAITSVTPVLHGATHTYPGKEITVNVTIKNEGDFTETSFNINASYDGNLIETKTVPEVTPQKETTTSLTWNTAGLPYGNYTISATATPLLDETDTTDNTYTDDWILVTIVGDVDGDRDVDVGDQRKMQLAMFTMPGYPDWNPNADVDGDGAVDVGDQRKQQLHMFEWW